ncbi:MAG TPA: flagellar basal body P-ring formation chaperone FlgA [Gammaproteobacteria bacterium]|nr:flagellar basal body P-ring formation chaperone FlgA [Gammaproteobacteria bacterium]
MTAIALLMIACASQAHTAHQEDAARQLADVAQRWQAHYQQVNSTDLVKTAKDALTAELARQFSRYEVTPVGPPKDATVPKGQVRLTAQLPPGSLLRPRLAVSVNIAVNGKPAAVLPVWFRVEVIAPVLVFGRDLPRGSVIGAGDVHVAERDLTHVAHGAEKDYDELPGRWLTRAVRAGDPVLAGELAREPLVKRDEPVKVLLMSGAIAISASGVAARNGYRGDAVKVLVDGAKAPCIARVVKKGVVKVVY